jgi:3-mercaptopyruvate sulfurtransferase SseA
VKLKSRLDRNRIWGAFFFVWVLLLSGILDFWVKSPGLKQWIKVNGQLNQKRLEIGETEARTTLLLQISRELQSNTAAQEREIRKVLGYLDEQEAVFEFSPDFK